MIAFDCSLARERFTLEAAFSCDGGLVALFGPSGSGKSTIVKLIAGIERPDRGRIELDGRLLLDTARRISVPVHKRGTGLVFQDGQLLPHLNVRQNLTYGRFFRAKERQQLSFDDVVDLLGLGPLLASFPRTLSGGERQRVAIGRALLAAPLMLLLDEPLASLDTARKLEILPFIERLRDETHLPIVYVSHSVEEVARLAATVVRLVAGKVVAVGPPGEILAPAMADGAAERFDTLSTITAEIARDVPDFGVTILAHPAGEIVVPGRFARPSGRVRIALRATNVALAIARPDQTSVRTSLSGHVVGIDSGTGPFALVEVELTGGERIKAFVTRLAVADIGLAVGGKVYALVKTVSMDELGISGLAGANTGAEKSGPSV